MPALLLGVPLIAHAPVALVRKLYTSVLHSDGAWRRSWLDRVVATPAFHRAHHDRAGNYAGLLACLDGLFGTRAQSTASSVTSTAR